mgnify:CR=1 FL=1
MKTCAHCKVQQELDEFHRQTKASDGRASWCKVCTNSITREYRKRIYSAENKTNWHLKSRYNLTVDQVSEMFANQLCKCAICKTELTKYHIDHSHETGKVRGLLCHKCNIRLGGWDDKQWREAAIKYTGFNL